jgi:hypothetical protein
MKKKEIRGISRGKTTELQREHNGGSNRTACLRIYPAAAGRLLDRIGAGMEGRNLRSSETLENMRRISGGIPTPHVLAKEWGRI